MALSVSSCLILVRLQALLAELDKIGTVQMCADSLVALSTNLDIQVCNQPVCNQPVSCAFMLAAAQAQPNPREQLDKVSLDTHEMCTEDMRISPCVPQV